MIFKKDSFIFGFIMGLIAPFIGFAIFKYRKLGPLSYGEALQYLFIEPGYRMLTIAISLSLLANAVLFTIYINAHIDKTAKGIFAATIIYALTALSLKTFG
jgi:uncharacterized membrane protein